MADEKEPLGVIARLSSAYRALRRPEKSVPQTRAPESPRMVPRRGGRLSADNPDLFPSLAGAMFSTYTEPSADETYRDLNLDSRTLSRISPQKLLDLLADLSPDVSRALWDFLRLCNPGWEVKVFRPGADEPDETLTGEVKAFLDTLDDLYGSVDIVFGRLYLGAFLRGAFCSELVLGLDGRTPVDLATPDPATIKFERAADPVRGEVWRPFQWQRGQRVYLDSPTFRYVPVDPFPGRPYGRPVAAPALFTTLFLLGLLHDLKRVVQQQGYPRLDISVLTEKLNALIPADAKTDAVKFKEWSDAAIQQVQDFYDELEPDDAFVHLDTVEMGKPVGTVDSSSLGAVDGLIQALERMSTRALKTMPLLMATTDGVSEANANRQWEIFAAGVKSMQHYCETMLERLLTLGLRAQGAEARVEFRFSELRAAELLRDAQVEKMQIENEVRKRNEGWISQDDASQKITGHDAVGEAPAIPTPGNAGNVGAVQAEPGSERKLKAV